MPKLSELEWLDSLSPAIKSLLEAAHDIDRAVLERMTTLSLESPTQPAEPESVDTSGLTQVGMETKIEVVPPAPAQPAAPIEPRNRLAALPYSAILPDDFLNACLWIEDTIGLKAHNLICCEGFETGRTWDPAKRNPGSSATGLIQFMRATALRLGTTVEDLAKMDRVHQTNYVYKYFRDFKDRGFKLAEWNLGDTYMAILYPPGIGKPDSTPIFVEGKGPNYAANHGLDVDKNGFVTRLECLHKILEVEADGMVRRRAA